MNVFPAVRPAISAAIQTPFNKGSGGGAASIIAGLFAAGQQGFWLPFTDFASLTQDAAGTLPYTALEQPVGRVLDRSGRGNHASQATSTARGVVSARVNMLTKTEQFVEVGKYYPTNIAVTENAGTAPDGTGTAIKLAATASAIATMYYEAALGQTAYRHIWYIKKGVLSGNFGNSLIFRNITTSTNLAVAGVDFVTGVVTHALGSAFSSTDAGGGWWKITGTVTSGFAATDVVRLYYGWGSSTATAGDFILVWHPDCRNPNLFNNATPDYQRVNTPTDYDSVGFPKYLRLDGTDDFYTCGGGGSTTGFFYSDVVRPTTSTFSALLADNTASGGYLVQRTNTGIYFAANAGAAITSVSLPLAANVQAFVCVFDDGVNLVLQVNGAQTSIARPAVAAGSATMYLGRYTTVAQYFSSNITEPIYRAGPPPNAYEREVIRTYQMQKAGML